MHAAEASQPPLGAGYDRADSQETAYLLRSPENARRLLASIERLEHEGGTEHGLLE